MFRFTLTVCCLLLLIAGAHAGTIQFVPPTSPAIGNWGTSSVTLNGIEIHGFQWTGSSWIDANLFGRNQTNDHGVGVCSRADGNNCGTTGTSGGDYNELDNAGSAELIRLTLPAGYVWDSVQVSSLDTNDSTNPANWERGSLYGSSNGDPNSGLGTLLCNFVMNGAANNACSYGSGEEPILTLSAGNGDQYLFFQANDWFNHPPKTNNDYLVYGATTHATPEPASLFLLGTGLTAIMGALRRKKNS